MKDAIGSVFNLTLLFVFILLVSGFALFSVNYYKAFTVKNEIISNLEAYRGNVNNRNFKDKVTTIIKRSGYHIGESRMNNLTIKYSAVYGDMTTNEWHCDIGGTAGGGWCYKPVSGNKIEVKTFVNTDIPIINRILSGVKLFEVSGETKTIK